MLRTGWLLGAPYEWGEHVAIGQRAGVTPTEIERIVEGSQASGWSVKDRAILRAAEELRENAMITDATWGELAKFLDERQRGVRGAVSRPRPTRSPRCAIALGRRRDRAGRRH